MKLTQAYKEHSQSRKKQQTKGINTLIFHNTPKTIIIKFKVETNFLKQMFFTHTRPDIVDYWTPVSIRELLQMNITTVVTQPLKSLLLVPSNYQLLPSRPVG